MKTKFLLGLIVALSFATTACQAPEPARGAPNNPGQGDPDPDPDPDPNPGDTCSTVSLSWTAPTHNEDGSVLTDLAGYRIYWGFTAGIYSEQLEVNDYNAVSIDVENLEFGRQYHFVATAVNAAGVESRYSSEAIKLTDSCPRFMSFARPTAHH